MTFHSILIESRRDGRRTETPEEPAFFADLNLDQLINAITASKKAYNLKPFFYTPLRDAETIRYRQEVMRDMEDETLRAHIKAFAEKMVTLRRYLAMVEELDFTYHIEGWFLEAALVYCEAVLGLARDLDSADLRSRGMLAFRTYLTSYIDSPDFEAFRAEARTVKDGLSEVQYCARIKNSKVWVQEYDGERDYTVDVLRTFQKFQQGAAKDYTIRLSQASGMNHVEAQILSLVARLFPEPFAALDRFCAAHKQFIDEPMRAFDRDIQFYVAYWDLVQDMQRKGLSFCYPRVSSTNHEVYSRAGFDMALATNLLDTNTPMVPNDFYLAGPERVIVVSGPNQGGKTTFARMFAQLHYLASLGCPVPGSEAQLFLFDQIVTHFERVEDIRNLRGKLQDDLVRIHDLLDRATPETILIVNEIFASTSLQDAVFLSREIMAQVQELDLLCVWVTFVDELASLNEKTVSMVSTVVPGKPAERTFKIVRKAADGLAYARSIAERHRLIYRQIKERLVA